MSSNPFGFSERKHRIFVRNVTTETYHFCHIVYQRDGFLDNIYGRAHRSAHTIFTVFFRDDEGIVTYKSGNGKPFPQSADKLGLP